MGRALGAVAVLCALALLGVQLTFSRAARTRAEFTFINGTEPRSLDPGVMTGQPEGRIAEAIFEGLTRLDARSLEPVPGVAERWEVSPDGLVYTFTLRPDARWSDGRPLTAHDFAYAWRRLQDPARGAEYAYILHMVRLAEAFNTHGGHASALAGPVREAFEALAAVSPDGVGADRWRRFVADQHLNDVLKGTPDPLLREVLARRGGLAPAELPAVAAALAAAGERRRAAHAEADARFGRDAGVFARDDRTLVVELVAPTPYFLELTAFYPSFPVPRHVVSAPGNADDWFLPGKIVSNGPFELALWRVNDRIRLTRSDAYWGRDAVRLASVDALPVENANTALNLYLTGEADWLPSTYPKDLVDVLRERPDFYSGPGMIVYYYRFNCTRPPLDDPRVREALNLAVDRRTITDEVLRLGEVPAYTLVPPGIPGYAPPSSRIAYDPERARVLLAEAGFPGGRGFPELGILYNTLEAHKKIAEVLADQLRRNLGVPVRAYNQEWQAYQESTLALDYDLARAGWIGDYLDPNTFLDLWVTNGGNNHTGWGDPVYDRLIRAAADVGRFAEAPDDLLARLREPERARVELAALAAARAPGARLAAGARLRMQLLREAEALLVQEAYPILPLYFYVVSGLVAEHVRGFHAELVRPDGSRAPNLKDLHPLRELSVVRDAAG